MGKHSKPSTSELPPRKLNREMACLEDMVKMIPLQGVFLDSFVERIPGIGRTGFTVDPIAQIYFPDEHIKVGKSIAARINEELDILGVKSSSRDAATVHGNLLQVNLEDLHAAMNKNTEIKTKLLRYAANVTEHHLQVTQGHTMPEQQVSDPNADTVVLSREEILEAVRSSVPFVPEASPLLSRERSSMHGKLTTSAAVSAQLPVGFTLPGEDNKRGR